jgi:hypothetical protein
MFEGIKTIIPIINKTMPPATIPFFTYVSLALYHGDRPSYATTIDQTKIVLSIPGLENAKRIAQRKEAFVNVLQTLS